jgi:hypothetical protein
VEAVTNPLRRFAALICSVGLAWLCSGCAATSVLSFAYEQSPEGKDTCISAGCAATAVLAFAYDKITEGDPTPCRKLNSVERALNERCGAYQPGTLVSKDVHASGLPLCPLATAARNPQLWPVLPDLLSKGALPEACAQSPLVALAQAHSCPDFGGASPASLQALRWLADADARAIHHDVVRLLSCPGAQAAGLSTVLDGWLAHGALPPQGLSFSPLAALHPSHLASPFAQALERQGHDVRSAVGAYEGRLPSGFDLALRSADRSALDWWLDRMPTLANRVPPAQGNQLPWLPLARVITPSYLERAEQQGPLVEYLLARGADPHIELPYHPGQSVLSLARKLNSPSLALLDPPVEPGSDVSGRRTATYGAAALAGVTR